MIRITLCLMLMMMCSGCVAPSEHLRFPSSAHSTTSLERRFDINGNGKTEFSIVVEHDRVNRLEYDDNEDGAIDRIYRLSDYSNDDVPHFIILFDSIPFAQVSERYSKADLAWFDPPVKVMPPFPTMSPVIFSRMLGAPPQPGAINQYYDRRSGKRVNRLFERTTGNPNSWERRLHYRLKYWENGLSFLEPRRWFRAELVRAKEAFDKSPDRVTLAYFASTAGMVSKYGREGVDECLDGLEQLCLQLLYERNGAIKISAVADHGHTLRPGTRIDLETMLRTARFTPADRLTRANQVVIEQDGLVNFAGVHTWQPDAVARLLASQPEIRLAMHMNQDAVVIRDATGSVAIEARGDRYRYRPIDADIFRYTSVMDAMRAQGTMDAEGYATADAWFNATIDHEWPETPPRVWKAFHGIVVNTPDVMIVTAPGFYAGLSSFDWYVDMASTHGGLDQIDSATFLLTMTGRANRPLRTEEVLKTVEPSYNPSTLRR